MGPRERIFWFPPTTLSSALALGISAASYGCNSDGGVAPGGGGGSSVPTEPQPCAVCVDTCQTDPGSGPVDCYVAEAGFVLLEPAIWDFESGSAADMYVYDDGSAPFLLPSDIWVPLATAEEPGEASSGGPCDDSEFAFHIQGGPFVYSGGGMGISLRWIYERDCLGAERASHCPAEGVEYADQILDLSEYEGVSFWARRGPDSQGSIRVVVGDKHVDGDMSFLSHLAESVPDLGPTYPTPRYCERVKECGCRDGKPCTMSPWDGLDYCWDPETDPEPGTRDECGYPVEYDLCGWSMCYEPYPPWPGFPDPQFDERPCTPFAAADSETGSFCFDPEFDPDPVGLGDRCGDFWSASVELGSDWEFHTVAFADLEQEGWAASAVPLDTSAITVIRLTWDPGWLDYWIDDVTFYRRQ